MQVGSYISEEEAHLDVQLEYTGAPAEPSSGPSSFSVPSVPVYPPGEAGETGGEAPAPERWARRVTAGVTVLLRPSLQVGI